MIRYLLFTFLILCTYTADAQLAVSGLVTDKDRTPMEGVNIRIDELNIGTVSDSDGSYNFASLPKGELIISYSHIGFKTTYRKVYLSAKPVLQDVVMDILIIEGQEVVISGNFTSTQHDNTVKINTISTKTLFQSPAISIIEAISEVPGVDFISKGPGIGTPVIRGLSLSNILFMNNGVPLQNYQFSANHPYMVDEYGIERIEVIKGPASLIYGSGAVGGIINLIGEPVAKEGTITGDADFRYISNTAGYESNIGLKGNHGGFFWGIRAGGTTNKDYIQGNGEFAPNTRYNRTNFKANTGIITNRSSFKILYQYNNDKLGLAVAPAFLLVTTNNRKNDVWYQALTNHLLISQNKLFLGNLKLEFDLSYQNNNRQLMGSEYTEAFTMVDMTLQTISYRLKSTYSINKNASIIMGVQGMIQNNNNFEAPDHVLPDADIWDFSIYGLGQYHFGERVMIEAGARFSYQSIYVPLQESSGHGHKKTTVVEDDHIEFDGDFNNISFSIGSTIHLSEQALIRINFASSYRNPNIAELTQNGQHGTRYEIGNPNLNTQQNTEVDIGFHLHTLHTSLDISAFYNNVSNYIYLAHTNDTTESGSKIYMYQQAASYLYGSEIQLHIHPHPIHWLHLKTNYSYVLGKQKSGEFIPTIPAQKIKLELRATKATLGSLRNSYIMAGVKFVMPQNNPSEFESSSQGYNIVNAGIGTELHIKNQALKFNFIVSNLFNTEYIDHLSTLRDLNILDMGRSFNIRLNIPFTILKKHQVSF